LQLSSGQLKSPVLLTTPSFFYFKKHATWRGLLWRPGAGRGFEPPPASARPCAYHQATSLYALHPHILDEEPGAAGGDDARVRRLATALRVEDRDLQHHHLPPTLLLRTPETQLSQGSGLGFSAYGGLFMFLHSAEEKKGKANSRRHADRDHMSARIRLRQGIRSAPTCRRRGRWHGSGGPTCHRSRQVLWGRRPSPSPYFRREWSDRCRLPVARKWRFRKPRAPKWFNLERADGKYGMKRTLHRVT
jgi:hypothetical protein